MQLLLLEGLDRPLSLEICACNVSSPAARPVSSVEGSFDSWADSTIPIAQTLRFGNVQLRPAGPIKSNKLRAIWLLDLKLRKRTLATVVQAEFKTTSTGHACLGVVDGCTIVRPKHFEIISALLLILETSKKVFGDNCLALIDSLGPAKSLDASGMLRAIFAELGEHVERHHPGPLHARSADNVLAIGKCSRHARIVSKWSSSSFNPESKLHSGQSSRSQDTCLIKGRRDQEKTCLGNAAESSRLEDRPLRPGPTRALQRVTRGFLGQIGDSISG
ncbi:hypothetical protein KCU83_g121, partial [Aureobasidium melanogenum]